MEPLEAYACYNKNLDVRLSSSSGAIFTALAENILENNGIVYGVAMTEDCYGAEFIRVEDKQSLNKLRGSKYLQAKVGYAYKNVKNDLLAGRRVLFSGTGCQVNGLKNFLGKNYDNLLCVDVICHGAPSPALWKVYVKHLEIKNQGKLKNVNFRCKDDSWNDFGMKEVFVDILQSNKLYISKDKDTFMQMFLRDYCLRPSCYECVAKKIKKSDLTIADFWGIGDVAPEMNDGVGTSLVLIRTSKGSDFFEKISACLELKTVSYQDAVKYNPSEYKSCVRPVQRNSFFHDMHSLSFESFEKKYVAPIKTSSIAKIKNLTKRILRKIHRTILGGKHLGDMNYCIYYMFEIREGINERNTNSI